MSKTIGIDLGTTNSVVAVMEAGSPKVLINSSGNRTTPSIVAFTDKDERLVGQPARQQQITNPKGTVFSIKRFMGRRHREVESEEKMVPYEVTGGSEDLVKVSAKGKDYTPQEISAMVLQNLKKTAEDYLGEKVTKAVITVPAYFNDSQRQATKEAGEIAGLEVERIINEPTAAALAYGLDKKANEKIAVFDLGGGTFDVSILDVGDGVFEVLATNGDGHLGGDDWDQKLIDLPRRRVQEVRRHRPPQRRDGVAAAQGSRREGQDGALERPGDDGQPAVHHGDDRRPQAPDDLHHADQVRADLRRPVRASALPLRDRAQGRQASRPAKIDEVVLVGGSTRIPKVQALAQEIFGKEPNKSINPDEVVALGAAIQGGVLQGDVKDVLLLDVTPLSLGIETMGGVMTKLIEKNTTIPTSKKETFSTAADNQTEVTIHVLQGEREFAKDNRTLGQFNLADIPPAPRGMPQIEVEFALDANGILSVSATDKGTGKTQNIEIKGSSGLSEAEIEKMKADAEANADADKAKRELVDLKNQAEAVVHQTNKQLEEHGDKIDAEVRGKIESAVSSVEEKIKEDDADAIKKALETLNTESMELGKAVYEATAQEDPIAGAAAGAAAGAGESAGGDDVIDAEYEVKD